jgi:putative ABC transport system ATP-binding protein
MNIIECQNIVKIYDDQGIRFEALHGLNFSIKEGEFLSITGPSGCGKSTLLNIIGLLDEPTRGKYTLNQKHVAKMSDYDKTIMRRDNIGFIFQSFNLLPDISVLENVKIPLRYRGASNKEATARAEELLKSVGLSDKKNNTPLQISGGQKQRVCIARALANAPKVIIADEPTGNLDVKSGREVLKIFNELNAKGFTIIMVTHDMEIAAQSRRIIKMLDGNIIDDSGIKI